MHGKMTPKSENFALFEVRIWAIEALETIFSSSVNFSNVLEARKSKLCQGSKIFRHIFLILKRKGPKKWLFEEKLIFYSQNIVVCVKLKIVLQEIYFLLWKNIVLAVHNGIAFDICVSGWGNTAVFVKCPFFWKRVRTPGPNTRKRA